MFIVYHIDANGWEKIHDGFPVDTLHWQYAQEKGIEYFLNDE